MACGDGANCDSTAEMDCGDDCHNTSGESSSCRNGCWTSTCEGVSCTGGCSGFILFKFGVYIIFMNENHMEV